MLNIVPSNQFKKDLKLAKKRGLKLDHLNNVINILAAQQPLADKHRDHNLTGNYQGFRECHIEPDWLLCTSELYFFFLPLPLFSNSKFTFPLLSGASASTTSKLLV